MSDDDIQTASVIRYSRTSGRGKRTGVRRKGAKTDRSPSASEYPRTDGDLLLSFPITTKEPGPARFTSEIPLVEKRRAGLDRDLRLWIILDE